MKAIIDGSIYAENYFNENFFTEYNWVIEILEDKDYNEYVAEINKNWQNISNELIGFSRLPLYNN